MLFHPTHLIPIMAAWHLSFTELSKHTSAPPISKNMNHLLHTLIFLLHYAHNYEMEHAMHVSIGFFSYDIIYMALHDGIRRNASYLLHHGITIYLLHLTFVDPSCAESIMKGYAILESSNIMLYVSYHVQKEWPGRTAWIRASEFVQMLVYVYFRMFRLSAFMYDIREELRAAGVITCAALAALYMMGATWSHRLVMKNAQHFAALKKMAA
jgi:hypothetical protein